ncbi:SAM-dependent methyltransferase [Jeongeupia sp. HS-3]|uniref:SAM-dependent methyltransferase n=1 Tax=Jeongeupia sp. HS-3 TaxID=1009682 RepID=UPI0018A4E1DE|nr:class I SAM-dependent methyltransferase [Jeongeupia sp. HS-3]BCL75766.1 SAM-dependent methyltransferase [Jeongeupia sp. HS-3]
MWDERYSTDDYAYGTTPNGFLADNVAALPKGRVLSLAEGEGRNAVFLATQGYAVTAVDASRVGLEKAGRLAEAHGVEIERLHADLAEFDPGEACWDGVVSIFCPLPSRLRKALHRKVVAALKPGGVFVLEAYTPAQLQHRTGGGSSADTMVTAAMLRDELAGLDFRHLRELEREVIEGTYHTGLGAVVQLIAVKPA